MSAGADGLNELNGACQARACFGTAKTLRDAKTPRAALCMLIVASAGSSQIRQHVIAYAPACVRRAGDAEGRKRNEFGGDFAFRSAIDIS
jgi:hypothetical protein